MRTVIRASFRKPLFGAWISISKRSGSARRAAKKNALGRVRPDASYDQKPQWVRDLDCADRRVYLEIPYRRVLCRECKAVKRERLDGLADNSRYTKRFAFAVGRRCRSATIKDVAEELDLDWGTVKELDKQYMAEQLRRAGEPAPRVIGIDEISVGPRHGYRIVVSDLERKRPIWFGGNF